ncbi:DUF4625 domain-containing protein [Globicatella sulfidifaciens]|uniref:DUF4625 domain-containing protein n=1 Tax=Globicatella sulfidifaciens TaxID=136093 RepID=A0A7X8C242_9LACT|nr:DUF4625 domain-containing protein [Globicatella sulfidifaciens]NLJ17545.1 DUF4625 domain-containing protein [Globicatella sulfidifaciens]
MKNIIRIFMITAVLAMTITSCKKDKVEPNAPTISNVEFGHDNNKTAYVGADLHVEADISAPGKIDNIKVELHPESGSGWEYSEVFKTDFEGLLNATFHKHIQISEDAQPGEYHLHFTVTDKNGKQTSEEAHIQIINDPSLPSVANYSVHVEDGGNTLHVEAHITAPNKIAEVEVEIHGPWEEEFEYDDVAMVGQTSYHFSKHIDISNAPSGHYHVHLGITDQDGKNIEFEEHFNK